MDKIANSRDFLLELHQIKALAETSNPSRIVLAGLLRSLADRVAAKAMTFKDAQEVIFDALEAKGWKVQRNLKVPHATSPKGGDYRLWFKAQAIYFSFGYRGQHDFKNARSIGRDAKEIASLGPDALVHKLEEDLAYYDKKTAAAPAFEYDGQTLTMSEAIFQAVGKVITRNYTDLPKWIFSLVMPDGETLFDVEESDYPALALADITKPEVLSAYEEDVLAVRVRGLSVEDATTYAEWVKDSKPSVEERNQWLDQKKMPQAPTQDKW